MGTLIIKNRKSNNFSMLKSNNDLSHLHLNNDEIKEDSKKIL